MNYLSAESLSKSFHEHWLFKDITLGISRGDKIALVGANGVGKSTLLKILTGQVQSDSGKVVLRDGIRTGYLTQQPNVPGPTPVKSLLFEEGNKVAMIVKQYEEAIHDPDTSPERMQTLLEQMGDLNAWDYDAKVQEITGKLGVPSLEMTFGELSGGQRKRIFLAQLLLSEPDLIVLDEPTNHLDLEAIEWLENYLSGVNITLIMVTHDRYFLDNVANEIFEIDRGKLFTYRGNYAYFLEKKSEREAMLRIEVDKAKNLLRKELEWMRKQPKARGTKAKYRIDAFYDLKEKASQNLKKDKLELDIQETRQGTKILELHNISKSYNGVPMVDNFSYVFKKQDRIGIVGKNGVGKSTFLNLLTGKIKADKGEIIPGVTTRMGYFTQEAEDLNPTHRVIEEVKAIAEFITLADGSNVSASKFLDLFLFPPEKQYTFIDKLSGGEKKRLQLLKVLITNPNFMILDEPTNDFDIDTLNVLEEFLEKFGGCLLLVSHDRYFMDHLVEQLFVFEGDGKIRVFNGNYSDYRSQEDEEPEEDVVVAEKKEKPKQVSKSSFKEKKEYEEIQKEIERLESEKKSITEKLNDASLSHQQLSELGRRIEEITKELDEKTNRWLELDEIMNS
ncbi:MAG TPA: ABC-F family ATP-binding cassette domain-containing protein [Cyclobacteriaceae bacterium]|nr:ABC-F family ATP-binding cassette domain-containing protein [Cyclobacteriaceae bacterium]